MPNGAVEKLVQEYRHRIVTYLWPGTLKHVQGC